MRVVNSSHFLTYFDLARTKYLCNLGLAYPDLVEVTTWVEWLRPTRMHFRQCVGCQAGGVTIAERHTVLACLNRDGRPRPCLLRWRPSLRRVWSVRL